MHENDTLIQEDLVERKVNERRILIGGILTGTAAIALGYAFARYNNAINNQDQQPVDLDPLPVAPTAEQIHFDSYQVGLNAKPYMYTLLGNRPLDTEQEAVVNNLVRVYHLYSNDVLNCDVLFLQLRIKDLVDFQKLEDFTIDVNFDFVTNLEALRETPSRVGFNINKEELERTHILKTSGAFYKWDEYEGDDEILDVVLIMGNMKSLNDDLKTAYEVFPAAIVESILSNGDKLKAGWQGYLDSISIGVRSGVNSVGFVYDADDQQLYTIPKHPKDLFPELKA
jgi:hypothetical protein